MKLQLYFPSRQADQLMWLRHFRLTLPQVAGTLGLSEQALSDALRDLDWLIHLMGPVLRQVRTHAQACTASLRLLMSGSGTLPISLPQSAAPTPPPGEPPRPGALNRLFKLVQTIKSRPGYNASIGLSLGIVGNLHARDSEVPYFTLKIGRGGNGEVVRGSFRRFGRPAVYVETRRAGGDWEPLGAGIKFGSKFIDDRPLLDPGTPEVREYRLCFCEDSFPSGNWTPVSSITVSP